MLGKFCCASCRVEVGWLVLGKGWLVLGKRRQCSSLCRKGCLWTRWANFLRGGLSG